jgi:transcriptional regulator with XRE-family HTH domain
VSLKDRLAELMKDEKPPLTQRAFAARIGVTQGAVAFWMKGAQPYPRIINAICAEFGVKRDWLLYSEGPKYVNGRAAAKSALVREDSPTAEIERKITFIEQTGTPEQLRMVDDFLESVCRQLGYPRAKSPRKSRRG